MFAVTHSPLLPLMITCYCACATILISAQVPLLVSYPMMDCLKLLTFSTLTRFKLYLMFITRLTFHLSNLSFCATVFWDVAQQVVLRHPQTAVYGGGLVNVFAPDRHVFGSISLLIFEVIHQ